MDPATIALIITTVAQVAPEILKTLEDVISGLKVQHPALGGPPPADGETAINQAVDQEIVKQFEK